MGPILAPWTYLGMYAICAPLYLSATWVHVFSQQYSTMAVSWAINHRYITKWYISYSSEYHTLEIGPIWHCRSTYWTIWDHTDIMSRLPDCPPSQVSLLSPLTHWGRDKMAAVFQTTFSNAFSWMKMYEFRLRFHWNLFLRFKFKIFQHWFR